MSETTRIWAQAAELFDELAPCEPAERDVVLAGAELAAPVRRWLDRLLAAHDRNDTGLIDRQVDELANQMSAAAGLRTPESFLGQRFGPWQLTALLGEGGMSLVFAGERADGQFNKQVAVKVLDPLAVSGMDQHYLEQEIQTLATLEHPGIVRMLDGGLEARGTAWLVMERVDGEELDSWIDRTAPPIASRIALFRQVGEALAYCHRKLVIHGDIKPGNVLVDAHGRARLLDFGISTRLAAQTHSARPGASPTWCSPGYASPQRLAGEQASISDDIYALGALLHRVLTGQGIRNAREQTRCLAARNTVSDRSPTISTTGDRDLDAIIRVALAPDEAARYGSVDALLEDLNRWRRDEPVAARDGGKGYVLSKWLSRHRPLALAGCIGFVTLLIGSGVALWQAHLAQEAAGQARAAQARAEMTSRFLLDLFEAEIPDLPPDQMPSTRQLLDQGIEQARDPDTGSTEMRADLLISMAGILLARRQIDEADALIDEAKALAGPKLHPAMAIRLAMLDVDSARQRNQFDTMQNALHHAIGLLRQHQPEAIERLEMQRDLARLYLRREAFDKAQTLLEALHEEARQRGDSHDLLMRLAGDLAVVAGRTGQAERAIERFQEVLALKQAQPDPSPLSLATTMVNLGGLHADLGQYSPAEQYYTEVLSLLESFADLPLDTRAASLAGLADLARWQGRFDEAERRIRESADEWRRVLNLATVDEDFFIHYYLAELYADAGLFSRASERIAIAIQRMRSGQEAPPARIAYAQADLARYLCHIGDMQRADAELEQALATLKQESLGAVTEARAICALAKGEPVAESLIPVALIEQRREHPGDVYAIARLELLRAEQLVEIGELEASTELLAQARDRLEVADLQPDHALLVRAESIEARLSAQTP